MPLAIVDAPAAGQIAGANGHGKVNRIGPGRGLQLPGGVSFGDNPCPIRVTWSVLNHSSMVMLVVNESSKGESGMET